MEIGDPLVELILRWTQEAERDRERFGDHPVVGLGLRHVAELEAALAAVGCTKVKSRHVEATTGYPKGTIQNRKDEIPNVGTGREAEYYLADLPFKAGHIAPAALVLALKRLREVERTDSTMSNREREVRERARRAG